MPRLQQVYQTIESLPDTSFADHYQQYVRDCQDEVLQKEVHFSGLNMTTLKDINIAEKQLSELIKEFA